MPNCDGCGQEFASRNAIFRHLKETHGACLDPKARKEFQRCVLLQDRKKVLVLYGYVILPQERSFAKERWSNCLENGQDAAAKLLHVLEEQCLPEGNAHEPPKEFPKINRSYGNTGRNAVCLKQDDRTGAITEVLATRLPTMSLPLDDWLAHVNTLLESKRYPIRVFGRIDMPFSKFDAEMHVTHRRVEYLLPADFLIENSDNNQRGLEELFETLPSFLDGNKNYGSTLEALNEQMDPPNDDTKTYLCRLKKIMQSLATKIVVIEGEGAVLEKEFQKQKRKKQCFKSDRKRNPKGENNDGNVGLEENKGGNKKGGAKGKSPDHEDQRKNSGDDKNDGGKAKGKPNNRGTKVLRRRRFHNFTHSMMAHDFFSFRRMDRVYHRATLRFPEHLYKQAEAQSTGASSTLNRNRAFLAISISGDLFLQGQICRVVGVLIALASGRINQDLVDCVFDEDYPHLVPTPPAPTFAMYAVEANYTQWEGKVKKILTAREGNINSYQEGWGTPATLQKVNQWQAITREEIAKVWLSKGIDSNNGRLLAEREWTCDVLEPWLVGVTQRLEHYRQWKKSKEMERGEFDNLPTLPPLTSIDQSVPDMYKKVLQCLRDADKSGLWPSTTPKRQMVMVSTPTDGEKGDQGKKNPNMSSLSIAHSAARNNKKLERSSAYAFQEGEGGASGSFSVGAMPGGKCAQPKGNQLFPELMKAAFELEIALCPDREPSSTIAINRNAQFRPHTDSGAGAGQSTSLIVALGNFVGGELVVEGKQEDIRYRALEFNGWRQRHWTMPLQGERYSLVWFTPKGCEGVRGIDSCRQC